MLDSVFVISSTDNSLVFYGQLSDVQTEDLETILGQILMKAKGQPNGTQKLIALKQGKFLYGIYSNFVMVLALSKGTEKEAADKILTALGKEFQQKYGSQIESYAGDNAPFASFSGEVQEILTSFMSKAKSPAPAVANVEESKVASESTLEESKHEALNEPEEGANKEEVESIFGKSEESSEVEETKSAKLASETEEETSKTIKPASSAQIPASQKKGMIDFQKSAVVKDTFNLEKPLIPPQKRQAYADGIPEYARDEILFNESFEVQKNFECDLVDFSVSRVKVTMNVSLTHIYEIEIDFTNYPERPEIILSDGLKNELGKPIEEISYFLRNWDPKIPAHITEIVYELEKILTRFKSEGKLSATQEMPSYATPELEPLKGDIKYDPNYKPKNVEVPAFIPEEVKPDRDIPGMPNPGAPRQPNVAIKGSAPAKPGSVPQAPANPADLKKQKIEEEKRRKDEEKKKKEEEKKQQEREKAELKKKKEFEKIKKQQAKEDQVIKKRQAEFDEDSEEKKDDI